MELVDICFNFTHSSFRDDEAAVLQRAVEAGVTTLMVTGSSVEESEDCIALAARYPESLYATAGVHPHLSEKWGAGTRARLKELAADAKVKAIGEAGLDYNRNYSPQAAQRHAFEQQIGLACETGLPLFLHQRDAHEDFVNILRPYREQLAQTVVHCFTGSSSELDAYLELDLHIGITGWICDERRGRHLHELVHRIPLDRLMIETDSPYLLPRDLHPKPKDRRNEPAYLPHILRTVARCLDQPAEAVAAATTANAHRFYGLR
ncbi:MAG: TatD family hydrolase [Gammaproteobacteria bacterium]